MKNDVPATVAAVMITAKSDCLIRDPVIELLAPFRLAGNPCEAFRVGIPSTLPSETGQTATSGGPK
jgi:hypothetical protein